jgi:hypothetical protein
MQDKTCTNRSFPTDILLAFAALGLASKEFLVVTVAVAAVVGVGSGMFGLVVPADAGWVPACLWAARFLKKARVSGDTEDASSWTLS